MTQPSTQTAPMGQCPQALREQLLAVAAAMPPGPNPAVSYARAVAAWREDLNRIIDQIWRDAWTCGARWGVEHRPVTVQLQAEDGNLLDRAWLDQVLPPRKPESDRSEQHGQ